MSSSSLETPVHARPKARVYVTGTFDGQGELRELLERELEVELVGWSEDARNAGAALAANGHNVVLHGTRGPLFPENEDIVASLMRSEIATIREFTQAPIVLLASGGTPNFLDTALESGVADVLLLPQMAETVAFAVRKASQRDRVIDVPAQAENRPGQVITVFSPKGGTGKTVLATNLAAELAGQRGQRVLLVDLDLQFGDAAIMLGVETEKTMHDLVAAPGQLDSEKLAGYTIRHSSGIDILAAPLRPEDAELVTEAKVLEVLEVARTAYDFVIVDTSPFFYGPMLATLRPTDQLLLLCGLDVPTLKNVRLSLQTLELLSFPSDRIRLVLNRVTPKVGMRRGEVEAALDINVRFEVPNDPAVPLAVNRGAPAVLAEERSEFAQAVRAIADSLTPAAVGTPQSTTTEAFAGVRRWLAGGAAR